MTVAAPTRQAAKRAQAVRRARVSRRRAPPPQPPVDLEALGDAWWSALDAADSGLRAAACVLTVQEIGPRRIRLAHEREATIGRLEGLARASCSPLRFERLRVSRAHLRDLLGLPSGVKACVFNLDGVLIGSAAIHAAAWAETFDEFIAGRHERAHGLFPPFNALPSFDPRSDYPKYIHAKTRLEGVRAFLASRGISLPEGDPRDPPGAETVHGLANRKNEALVRRLEGQGVYAFEGSRRYLQLARDAGIHRGVVSASAHAGTILEKAALAELTECTVDGNAIVAEHLRARPAPDIVLAACRQLDVRPEEAAVFEVSPAGVVAARAAGCRLVIGVDRSGDGDALRAAGADLVVGDLAELLERRSAA